MRIIKTWSLFILFLFLENHNCFSSPIMDWEGNTENPSKISSASNQKASKELDRTVDLLSRKITKKLNKKGESIAISHFLTSENKLTSLGLLISEKLINKFSEGDQLIPVERDFMFKLTEEMKLGMTGLMESKTLEKAGKFLEADYILAGTIQNVGKEIIINIHLVKTQTAQIIAAVETSLKSNSEILALFSSEINLIPSHPISKDQPKENDFEPPTAILRKPTQNQNNKIEESTQTLILNQDYYDSHYKPYITNKEDQEQKEITLERKNDEYYRKREQELKEVDKKNEAINEEIVERVNEREKKMDVESNERWKKMQKDREKEIENLNKHAFIVFAPYHNHPHLKKKHT